MERRKLNSQLAMCFVFLQLCLVCTQMYANVQCCSGKGDSLKNKYNINDPRNPDCPCHIYQKKAEREYKKLLKNQEKQTVFVLPVKAEPNRVKNVKDVIAHQPRLVFKRHYKTDAFNRSRKRSKKGIFRVFKKTISDCPF